MSRAVDTACLIAGSLLLAACQQPADEIIERSGAAAIVFVKETSVGNNNSTAMSATEFYAGTDLYLLSPISPSGNLTNLTERWTRATGGRSDWGHAQDPEVSFDGKRILFAMRESRRTKSRICELDLETGVMTRLTAPDAGGDFDPAYIDDTRIVFASTRNQITDEYERREATQLFVGERGGPGAPLKNIRQITFNQSHDQNPFLHSSGKIFFSRWDHLGDPNKMPLFTIDPDGTGQFVLYGADETFSGEMASGSRAFLEARELADGGIVSSMMDRASAFEGGAVCVIDLSRFTAPPDMITPSTSPYNTTRNPSRALFKTPYPVRDNGKERLLVAQSPREAGADTRNSSVNFDLFVMDKDGRDLRVVHSDPETNDYDAVVVAPRALPAGPFKRDELVEAALAQGGRTGMFFTADVYSRMNDGHMKPDRNHRNLDGTTGQARYVRFLDAVSMHRERRGGNLGRTNFEKQRVIGYADVRSDGSYSVEAPANTPLHHQVLDEHGHMLINQLQWMNVMPGERRICTGCHGPRDRDTDIRNFHVVNDTVLDTLNAARKFLSHFHNAQSVTAHPAACGDTVDFLDLRDKGRKNTIQAVLDTRCNSCHGTAEAASKGGALILADVPDDSLNNPDARNNPGNMGTGISTVYRTLTRDGGYVTAKEGTRLPYVVDDGIRRSPLGWVLYHRQLGDEKEVLFRLPSFDHSTLWKKDSTGRLDPFDRENADLLTLIEWMDMGAQFSNTIWKE